MNEIAAKTIAQLRAAWLRPLPILENVGVCQASELAETQGLRPPARINLRSGKRCDGGWSRWRGIGVQCVPQRFPATRENGPRHRAEDRLVDHARARRVKAQPHQGREHTRS